MCCDKTVSIKVPSKPGNGETATLFDSTIDPVTNATLGQRGVWLRRGVKRLRIGVFPDDQNVTLTVSKLAKNSSTWDVVYTGTVTAGTDYDRDQLWVSDDMKVEVVAGATAPTNLKMSMMLDFQRALGA